VAGPSWRPQGLRGWLAVAAVAVVVVGLTATVVVLLLRPAPATKSTAAAQQAEPSPSPSASPSPSPSPNGTGSQQAADQRAQQRQYRAYVTSTVTHGTALAADLASLKDCRANDRGGCEQKIAAAKSQVDSFLKALDENPAPSCLTSADDHLRDGLTFQQRGLQLTQEAISSQDRVKLSQGAMLLGAGLVQQGQAVRAARQADCPS
jgi:hypothetical protein